MREVQSVLRSAHKAYKKYLALLDARRENNKRIRLHVEYGRTEFDWVTHAMEARDFCVGGIAYALINVIISVKCHSPYRCMYAVAWKLPACNG